MAISIDRMLCTTLKAQQKKYEQKAKKLVGTDDYTVERYCEFSARAQYYAEAYELVLKSKEYARVHK